MVWPLALLPMRPPWLGGVTLLAGTVTTELATEPPAMETCGEAGGEPAVPVLVEVAGPWLIRPLT